MLTAPNHSNVVAVNLNSSIATQASIQPTLPTTQSIHSTFIIPPSASQGSLSQIISGGQIVNLTPVRSTDHIVTATPASNKIHPCPFCNKQFSSRYNVTRHEKICKLNTTRTNATSVNQVTFPIENKHFFCLTCQKVFASQELMTRHQKKCKAVTSVQTSGNRSFVQLSATGKKIHLCKYCCKEFSTKWNVIRHERLFHDPSDPVAIPASIANGQAHSFPVTHPPGKPERYCRFCGNYFSSKYNAIRHEKICTRVGEDARNNVKSDQTSVLAVQTPAHSQQQNTVKPMEMTAIATNTDNQDHPSVIITEQQHSNTQQNQIQQQIVQQQINQQQPTQIQTNNLQNNQQQLLPQQTMLLIEQPLPPFHVCKFCNKQLQTRCDPATHNILSSMPTVATINGQTMQIGSSGAQLTGLVTPVMASLPQVTLVQPQFSNIQGQNLQQNVQLQQEKSRVPSREQQIVHNTQQQQQITLQHIRLQPQQLRSASPQIQVAIQQQPQQQVANSGGTIVERPHSCKYCDKHFATKWYLDQHEKIHTGEADMCKECGKYFVTRWHLEKHMRVHSLTTPSPVKKLKKDVSSTTAVMLSTSNTIPTDVGFQNNQVEGDNSAGKAGDDTGQTNIVYTLAESNQFFDPTSVSSAVVTSSIAQVTASREEEHSTIDKSQIESGLLLG